MKQTITIKIMKGHKTSENLGNESKELPQFVHQVLHHLNACKG
jgi:hypothetical protein